MRLVDLNLLLYSTNTDSPHHGAALNWIETVLSGEEPVAFAWVVILGFVRISTRTGAFVRPLTTNQAFEVVDSWLNRSCATILHPGEQHWALLQRLLKEAGTAGNLSTDAHLAALAIEYGATLCSSDNDFVRFGRTLRFFNPLTS